MTECRLVGAYQSLRSTILLRNVGGLHVYQIRHGVVNQKNITRNAVSVHPVTNHSDRSLQWRVIILNGTSWTLPLGSPFSFRNISSALSGSRILYGTTLEELLLVFNQPTWAFTLNYDFSERIGSLSHLHYLLLLFFCCTIKRCLKKQTFVRSSVVQQWIFSFNLLKPTGYVMHQQFNIQQLYVLPTLYLCVLYLSENKQRLVPLIS